MEDEINLRDYLDVIIKRKKIILTVFFICVITTTVVSFLMPRVYETSATIEIGSTSSHIDISTPLISKDEAIQKLQARKILNSIIQKFNLNIDGSALKKMMKIEDIKNTNLLKLKIQHSDPQLAVKICNAIVDSFVLEQKKTYDKKPQFLNEQIEILKKRNQIIEKEIEKLNRVILPQTNEHDFLLIQNTLSNYETLSFKLNERIYSLRQELTNCQEPKVFERATTPKASIKPNKKLNITISAMLGLMIGVFIAFFQEFWQKGK